MFSYFAFDTVVVCFVGVGGSLLGLVGWIVSSSAKRHCWQGTDRLSGLLGLGLVGCSQLLGTCRGATVRCLGLSFSPSLRLLRWADDLRLQSLLLLIVCPALAVWWTQQTDSHGNFSSEAETLSRSLLPRNWETQTHETILTTDRGRPVRLRCWTDSPVSSINPEEEREWLRSQGFLEKVIQRAPPTPSYHCHGWVFSGGRGFFGEMSAPLVAAILTDNDYQPVSTPQSDDLVIYRDNSGSIIHSGIVRYVDADGLVLVESKWGLHGRYLHPADVYCCPTEYVWTCYRSPRRGHLLRGLESGSFHPGPESTTALPHDPWDPNELAPLMAE